MLTSSARYLMRSVQNMPRVSPKSASVSTFKVSVGTYTAYTASTRMTVKRTIMNTIMRKINY